MKTRLALSGFGNVGQGLATLMLSNTADYRDRYGVDLLLTAVADRGGAAVDASGLDLERLLRVKSESGTVAGYDSKVGRMSPADLLDASRADMLVEAASTSFEDAEPGWTYVREAIDRGMEVVLASKGCLALFWDDLFSRATEAGVRVRFSATVGSPLPTLDVAGRSLVGTDIRSIEGIVNSTTHQILTAMSQGLTYDEGVKQAQEMGFAETDPTLDVDGWDAAAKIAILANAIFGSSISVNDVKREGIRGVRPEDLREATANRKAIKLIARAARQNGEVAVSVAPESRPIQDPLGRLTGDAMGTVFTVEPLGTIALTAESSGHGGGITTAMTVLRDVLNLARDRATLQ